MTNFPPAFRLNNGFRRGLFSSLPMGSGIPKLIHQTFHAPPWPVAIQANIAALIENNPGWIHKFYDDDDVAEFIECEFGGRMLSYYQRINRKYGAARADFFRYLVIYRHGGVYLDIKSTATAPLSSVLRKDDSFILSNWRNKLNEEFEGWGQHRELEEFDAGEFQQWFLAAAPGHPFLKAVVEMVCYNIDHYIAEIHGVGAAGTLRTTGPIPYTKAIASQIDKHPYRLVDLQNELSVHYSLYGFNRNHAKADERHYSKIDEPLVNMGFFNAAISEMVRILKLLRQRLRRKESKVSI